MNSLYVLLGVRKTTPNGLCLIELGYPKLQALVKQRQYAFFHKPLEERGQMADDPLLFCIHLATKNKTQTGRYIENLLAVPPENDILQELKAQIESSDRTKFKTYKLMNLFIKSMKCKLIMWKST